MRSEDKQQWFEKASAIFRAMLHMGKPVAFEDAIKLINTDDWFDRRGFGWIPLAMHRDGEIEPAGFRESVNVRHHNAVKRLWILLSANEKGAAQ
jgi:hypothetical protein